MIAVSFITLFDLNFTFSVTAFLYFIFIFGSQSPFLIIFLKHHVGLLLKDKEATQPHTLLSVCELNNMYNDQLLTDFEKGDVIGH